MTLQETIYRRRSCRSFTGAAVDAATVDAIRATELKALYPEIGVRWDIVRRDQVKCICPWTTPQVIAVYSEEKEGWLENVGFLFQQLDLHLQSLGLGVCWLGMGKMNPKTAPEVKGMKFVIMLAFGHAKGGRVYRERQDFKRKTMAQITDRPDQRLEAARLAPSSVNSQPWYFVHEGDVIHVYCTERGHSGFMNRIDTGIALAHLYVENPETFRFFRVQDAPAVPGHICIGSIEL